MRSKAKLSLTGEPEREPVAVIASCLSSNSITSTSWRHVASSNGLDDVQTQKARLDSGIFLRWFTMVAVWQPYNKRVLTDWHRLVVARVWKLARRSRRVEVEILEFGLCFNTVHGGPQKVIHYQESSLNRIKNASVTKFLINFEYKMSTKCHKFVLNILCVTLFVTSSVAVFEAVTWVKSMYMTKSWLKTRRKENMEIRFF